MKSNVLQVPSSNGFPASEDHNAERVPTTKSFVSFSFLLVEATMSLDEGSNGSVSSVPLASFPFSSPNKVGLTTPYPEVSSLPVASQPEVWSVSVPSIPSAT